MAFFNSAVGVLQTLVIALGAGLGIWGVINLLEGYGIHLRYWNREYDWKYQHNTFLQPKKGQGRRCTEVRESHRYRYTYHRCIFDSGICHNFLERKGNVFHCYSGARHRLGLYLVCTVQVQ